MTVIVMLALRLSLVAHCTRIPHALLFVCFELLPGCLLYWRIDGGDAVQLHDRNLCEKRYRVPEHVNTRLDRKQHKATSQALDK